MMQLVRSCLALIMVFAVVGTTASVVWDVDANGRLTKNGAQVVLRGFSTTCLEYILRGIGV